MVKPIYKIPSMAEVENTPWNGRKVVSTFSGCGGSCLGYRMAGYKVVYANEFISAARKVYKLNHPDSYLDSRDIRKVTPEDILFNTNLSVGEIDIFDGSPPCADFSSAGTRQAGWGREKKYSDTVQRVDDLFYEYVRLVDGLKPKVFVAENVDGLVRGKAKGYFKKIIKALTGCGYKVRCKLIDAQWLGVPQSRKRTIFIGVRSDLSKHPQYPQPLEYQYTIGEAVKGLDYTGEEKSFLKEGSLGYKYWMNCKAGESFDKGSERYANLHAWFTHKKLSPLKVSSCILTRLSMYHWLEPRLLTISEIKRLSSFPDDFKLVGEFPKKWERIGRAVPPLMMKRVAETINEKVLLGTP